MAKLKIFGTFDNDVMYGTSADEVFYGYAGTDHFFASEGADHYDGGKGVDSVDYRKSKKGVHVDLGDGSGNGGLADGDTYESIENVYGTYYEDILEGDDADNRLYGFSGDDWLDGGAGDDVLSGSIGNDRLYGRAGVDTLLGGSGDDSLDGGSGGDVIDGGSGIDTLTYAASSDGVTAWLGRGLFLGGDAADDQVSNVENLTGSNHGDWLGGDAGVNVLRGLGGNDVLIGGAGADVLNGGSGIDQVDYRDSSSGVVVDLLRGEGWYGDAEGDTIIDVENILGSGFDDILQGDQGANEISGGGGQDMLAGDEGADVLDGGAGFDSAVYFNSNTGVTIDLAAGTASGGHAEGDVLISIESVRGAAYFENVLRGDDGLNGLWGGLESDLIEGRGGDDWLFGFYGDDILEGGDGNDSLYGEEGDDLLEGGEGDDALTGDEGDDLLDGGDGNDILEGGSGADIFRFVNTEDETDEDVVRDFEVGVDKIDFIDDANFIDSFNEFLQYSEQVGDDVVIDNISGTITLEDVLRADLSADDFLF